MIEYFYNGDARDLMTAHFDPDDWIKALQSAQVASPDAISLKFERKNRKAYLAWNSTHLIEIRVRLNIPLLSAIELSLSFNYLTDIYLSQQWTVTPSIQFHGTDATRPVKFGDTQWGEGLNAIIMPMRATSHRRGSLVQRWFAEDHTGDGLS
jgi:hypothetical protein